MQGTPLKLGKVTLQTAYSPGKSPAIVFVHGGLGSRMNWSFQWQFFQAQGQEILAYDLAGHGESGRYGRYSLGRHRRDLNRLLQHFNIHQPILCCHSYGVPIGLEWANRHATTALIAIAGGTHNLTPWWEVPLIKLFAIGGHRLYHWQPIQEIVRSFTSDEQLAEFYALNNFPSDAHPYEAIEAFWGYDGRHYALKCPVTVITGGNDPMFPPTMGHQWLASLMHHSESRHITVPDVGHLIMAEAPNVVNHEILRWTLGATN